MKQPPLLLEIKENCLDDGPGIRSVVFFKGCPLSCVWCHNPESQRLNAELSYEASRCLHCEPLLCQCPEQAISPDNPDWIDRERCQRCFECVARCPTGALSQVGHPTTAEAIVRHVLKDKPFFEASGGGVTLSGGEPTLPRAFVSKLLQQLKSEGIHTLLQTCGLFHYESFEQEVLPYLDRIYFDLKLYHSSEHRTYCGTGNQLILENFARLYRRFQQGGPEVLPRTPLVPGITDSDENLTAIASFLQNLGVSQAQLLSYNPLWFDKQHQLGRLPPYSSDHPLNSWMPQDREKRCQQIFQDRGIQICRA